MINLGKKEAALNVIKEMEHLSKLDSGVGMKLKFRVKPNYAK